MPRNSSAISFSLSLAAARLLPVMIAVILTANCNRNNNAQTTSGAIYEDASAPAELSQADDFATELHAAADTLVVLFDSIQRGEGPFNVMERFKIDRNIRQKILFELANETDFTTLRVGEKFAAVYDPDTARLHEFVYFRDRLTTHRIKLSYDSDTLGVTYVLDEKPHRIRHRLIRGTLNRPTLDAEFKDMGLPPQVAQIASGVLECKIAFRTDARTGDKFELLLKEVVYTDTVDGEPIEQTLNGRTDILYAAYSGVRAKEVKAYKFFDGDKSSYNAHYTEDGEALIFSGLRYPLDRIHITSQFGMRRHPVTGSNTMHNGVDYRASVGTPVYAVAEGRVTKSAFDNASGHYIAIRHGDGYSSYYLHLSIRSVNVGANVRARQVIGRTGNSGLSAGPHLHFGFRQPNGAWMNPLSKRMIAVPKLTGEKLEKLTEQIEEIRRLYDSLDG